jgi:CO dehydrogenase maturation factor
MRIAFVGKGGSGKTTLSSLFARHLAEEDHSVLAIDADINQHLHAALGGDSGVLKDLPAIGEEKHVLKSYFAGQNERIADPEVMIKTTPPGRGSKLIGSIKEENPIFDRFTTHVNGVRFMAVGTPNDEDVGVRCYHSKTGSVELFLNHTVDGRDEYVVVDMTAGADAFASSLFDKFDLTVLVVEPTLKSVGVFEQYSKKAKDHDVAVKAVGNKIAGKDDVVFLKNRLGGDLIDVVLQSDYVRKLERGERPGFDALEDASRRALSSVKSELDKYERDWDRYLERTIEFHRQNAEGWANESKGIDLTKQIDPEFSYIG